MPGGSSRRSMSVQRPQHDTPLQSHMWWWTVLDYALSGVNTFAILILPWIVFNAWSVVRNSTAAALVACAVLVNLLVGAVRHVSMGLGLDEGARPVWALWTLGLVWAAQIAAAASAPYLLSGPLSGFLYNPGRVQLVYAAGGAIFSFLILSVLSPAFAEASPFTQVILRVVVYTALFEVVVAGVRVCTRINFTDTFPRDNIVVLLSPVIIVSGLLGRILSTSMDTLGETIGVAVALSATEVLLRMTLPSRDRVLVNCCVRWCRCSTPTNPAASGAAIAHAAPILGDVRTPSASPGPALRKAAAAPQFANSTNDEKQHASLAASHTSLPVASSGEERVQREGAVPALRARAAREAQDIHAYFSLLTLDTMSEDIGILLSLPFALIMRLPPRVGGQPLGVLDVLARVGGQYALELLTDLAPALLMVCVNVCCGVRWRRVGGGAVRGAVLRQLAAEAAGEHEYPGKAVGDSMGRTAESTTQHTGGVPEVRSQPAAQVIDDSVSAAASGEPTDTHAKHTECTKHHSSAIPKEPQMSHSLYGNDMAPLAPSMTISAAGHAEHKAAAPASGDPGEATASNTPSQALLHNDVNLAANSSSESDQGADTSALGADDKEFEHTQRRETSAQQDSPARCCNCVLRTEDPDVARHRRHLACMFKRSIRRVTDDATWQPLEWQGMLRLAVEGSSGDGDEAPARVLWRDVRRVEDMSAMQLLVARVSVRSEMWAVRMGRAWEGRFRGWNVLFFVGVFSAALLVGRNLAGPVARCMLRDSDGDAYFDFCPEEQL